MLVYKNLQKDIRILVNDEDKTVNETFTVNGTSPHIINYSEHCSLILSIMLPQARELKRWVTAMFLTPIRKTGGYILYTLPRILARELWARNLSPDPNNRGTGCQPADLLISAIIEKTKKNTILQYYNFTRIRIYDTCKTFHIGGVLSLLQSHSQRIDNTVGWKPVPHWVVSYEQ